MSWEMLRDIIIGILVSGGTWVITRINDHESRLVKQETLMGQMAKDVTEIKDETKEQTKILYEMIGKNHRKLSDG